MKSHTVEIGDQVVVRGQAFIVTKLTVKLDKPAQLETKQPIELMDVHKES